MKLTDDEMNSLIRALGRIGANVYSSNKPFLITKEGIEDDEADGDIPSELLGYKVKVETDGDHRNDGQLVDYEFTFISPKKIKTKINTEMCLMVGWNFCKPEYEIK